MNGTKENENQILNVTDPDSPTIPSAVESPAPPHLPLVATAKMHHRSAASEFQAKRPRIEPPADDYDTVDMGTPSHFLPEAVPPPDDSEVFGRSVAAQIRQMSRPQKILTMRLISEVCFRGQIQALTLSTVLGNQPSTVLQQVQPPVLPPYAIKPLNTKPSEYLAPHHSYSSVRQPPYAAQTTMGVSAVAGVGLTAYQGCMSMRQQHPDTMVGANIVGHTSLNQNDVMP